jgi:hypothetical protein
VHPNHKLKYEEIITGETAVPRFQYSVTIEGFSVRFGHGNPSVERPPTFSSKQRAKQHTAREAVQWLVLNKHMPGDGSVKFPKPQLPPTGLSLEQNALQALGKNNWVGRLQGKFCTMFLFFFQG